MGLYNFENLGDPIITLCVKYLVEKEGYIGVAAGFQPKREGRRFNLYKRLRKIAMRIKYSAIKDYMLLLIMRWFISPHCKNVIRDNDALIFGCGSYKYSTQNLWMTYSIAIDFAKKYNKPVMFHGVNIEKYRQEDWRCRYLAKRTNYKVVKLISTRDGQAGVKELKESYITNNDVKLFDVGDSAFWLKEAFSFSEKDRNDVVGINLIREGIFHDYGGTISDEELIKIYRDILLELDKRHIKWELFTNGMKEDMLFGKKVLVSYGDATKEIRMPKEAKELIELISGYKAIIAGRLHASIIAYITNTPLVGFIWDNKLVRFAQENQIEDRFCKAEDFSGISIVTKLMQHLESPYDNNIKFVWKEKNREALRYFLQNYVN